MAEPAFRRFLPSKDTQPTFISDIAVDYSTSSSLFIVKDIGVVENMFTNLFSTVRGERGCLFEPTFGSMIPYFLHEPVNDETAWRMETEIFESVRIWMDDYVRLITERVRVSVQEDEASYKLYVPYLVNLPSFYNQVNTYTSIINALNR